MSGEGQGRRVGEIGCERAAIITKESPQAVADTVARLLELLDARGLTLFEVIDHSGEAARHGLELRDTKLVLFGDPVAGTPAMVENALAALDLPLKVLVWEDGSRTRVSYLAPAALAARHGLGEEAAKGLAGIDALTDALVRRG
jgi:uncharacterized protein (DUF302 family)